MRATTAIGNLRGATEIAKVVGRVARRSPVSVAVSEELESPLSDDLVLIGFPGKNAASGVVVNYLKRQHPEIGFQLTESDTEGCKISLAGFSADFTLTCQNDSELPSRDLALIILWVNPTALQKRRLILCAGFTSYGTAAAARYVVNDIVVSRYRHLRKESKGALPSLYSPRRWPCFAMIIETSLINDQVVNVRERAFVPLPDPGRPPWPPRR
jgi:hypothetical protein